MIDDLILAEQLVKKCRLSDRYKYAVIAYFILGKTQTEIGKDLKISKGTVHNMIEKTIRNMRHRYDPTPPATRRVFLKNPYAYKRVSEAEYYRLLKDGRVKTVWEEL